MVDSVSVHFKNASVSKNAFKHSYTVECGNRLRVGVLVLKTLAYRGLRVGPSKIASENMKFLGFRIFCSEKAFASQERVSGFPERKGLTFGEVRKTSGELPGKSGKLPGNPWIAVKFHSERTSGKVAEKLPGKFGELPGKSGDFPEARGSLTPSQRLAEFAYDFLS